MSICVIDCETTGLDPRHDRIVALAIHTHESLALRPIRKHQWLVNPGRPSSEAALAIHGIPDDVADEALPIDAYLPDIREVLLTGAVLGHHVAFDLEFLEAEFRRAGHNEFAFELSMRPSIDTRALAVERWPDRLGAPHVSTKLEAVAHRLGVPGRRQIRHDAGEDCRIAWEIFREFMRTRFQGPDGKNGPIPPAMYGAAEIARNALGATNRSHRAGGC